MRLFGNAYQNYHGPLNIIGSIAYQYPLTVTSSNDLGGINITGAQNNVTLNLNNTQAGALANWRISSSATGSGFGAGFLVIGTGSSKLFSMDGSGDIVVAGTATIASSLTVSSNGANITGAVTQQGGVMTLISPASGQAFAINNNANSLQYFIVNNTGAVSVQNSTTATAFFVTGNSTAPAVGITAGTGQTALNISAPSGTSAINVGTPSGTTVNAIQIAQGAVAAWALQNAATTDTIGLTTGSAEFIVYPAGGVVLGGATGGNEGLGTLNAIGLYVAGAAVYSGIPVNAQSANYTVVQSDSGKNILQTTTGHTTTIPSGLAVGSTFTFSCGAGVTQTIGQGASVTLTFAPSGGTGNRTLTGPGVATASCVNSNAYLITGTGLT